MININILKWINQEHTTFSNFFVDSVNFEEKNNDNEILKCISQRPDKLKQKTFSQYFTPSDVALYTSYSLLKDYTKGDIVMDPCVGKGSLLISIGIVLALIYGLRDQELLKSLSGYEICEETYNDSIINILNGLSIFISNLEKNEAFNILYKNILNADFLKQSLPSDRLVIVNPPYKEKLGENEWITFVNKIIENNNKSLALIVPVSICSSDRALSIRKKIIKDYNRIYSFHHEIRPKPLFHKIEQRITILIAKKVNENNNKYYTTGFLTHKSGNRMSIWNNTFSELNYSYCNNVFPKLYTDDISFFKIHNQENVKKLSHYLTNMKNEYIWIHITGRYKINYSLESPKIITSKWKKIYISEIGKIFLINAFENGDVIRWWRIFGDGRDLSIKKFLNGFSIS